MPAFVALFLQYFFDEYSTKTKQQLERFDHEFGATLRAERIRLDKVCIPHVVLRVNFKLTLHMHKGFS